MNINKMYGLFLRHFFLIKSSLPRILDLIYWPTIQIILWGFISKFFSIYSDYYSNTLGVILTCAILYDILFRSSISFNMLFLEEIWSRNFTNLFIAPLKIKEIIIALIFKGDINKFVKFLLQISSKNNMLNPILVLNKKSYRIAHDKITPTAPL